MKLLVCCKTVPDLDMMREADWAVTEGTEVATRFVPTMLNPYDESALEMALKLRGNADDIHLTALTVGQESAERTLKHLYALRYDRTVRIEPAAERDLRYDAQYVAGLIAAYIDKIGMPQLLLLGNQCGEGDNAQTPFLLAEMLAIPCITAVSAVRTAEGTGGDSVTVVSQVGEITVEQTVRPPLLLTIGNVARSYLRVPTLRDKMQFGKREVERYKAEELLPASGGQDERRDEPAHLLALSYNRKKRAGIRIEGKDTAEQVQKLYDEYLYFRLG